MKFTKSDVIQLENTIKALKRGKFDLQGEEILAFGQMFQWLGGLHKGITDLISEEAQKDITPIKVVKSPVSEPAAPNKKSKLQNKGA